MKYPISHLVSVGGSIQSSISYSSWGEKSAIKLLLVSRQRNIHLVLEALVSCVQKPREHTSDWAALQIIRKTPNCVVQSACRLVTTVCLGHQLRCWKAAGLMWRPPTHQREWPVTSSMQTPCYLNTTRLKTHPLQPSSSSLPSAPTVTINKIFTPLWPFPYDH